MTSQECRLAMARRFEELLEQLRRRGLVAPMLLLKELPAADVHGHVPVVPTDMEPAPFFRFREICQRSEHRLVNPLG